MPNQLQHKYKIVAGQPNHQDFIDLLEALGNEVADIRTNIGQPDTVEIRKAIAAYLKLTVDTIRRIRKNESQRQTSSEEDDD